MGAALQSDDAILQYLEQTLGDRVLPWASVAAEQQRDIATATRPGPAPMLAVAYPQTQAELQEVMALAHGQRWSVLPMGSSSKLAWGGLGQPVTLGVSTAKLTQVVEHAVGDLTLTAEAGTPVASLQPMLQQERQQLGFNPAYPERATLGGVIATADTGWMRQRYGGIRDMLIGVSLVRADGQLVKAGGRVVKNVAGYDLMKLMTGSWGSLGLISEVTLRTYPRTEASKTLVITGSFDQLAALIGQLLKSRLTPTGLTLVDSATLDRLQPQAATAALLVRFQSVAIGVETQAETLSTWAAAHDLVATPVTDGAEQTLWDNLQQQRDRHRLSAQNHRVTAKVGMRPNETTTILQQLDATVPVLAAVTHVASGIGWIALDLQEAAQVTAMREIYQQSGGFLSVLEAPPAWKANLDIWGYSGNALSLMRRLKQQFDPHSRLSPGRFLV